MNKFRAIGIIYSNNNYKDLVSLSKIYNIYLIHHASSFDLLDCVIRQKPNFLLIDVDNNLPENIKSIIEEYMSDEKCIRLISKNNYNDLIITGLLKSEDYGNFFAYINTQSIINQVPKYEISQSKISLLLKELRLPAKLCGFNYLKDIIHFIMINGGNISILSTYVYPQIARKNNRSIESVQRCISRMIENNYNSKTKYIWVSVLQATGLEDYCPTNKELVSLIIDKLISEMN